MAQRDTNPFPYSDSNKRYLTQDYYLRTRFGQKVTKLSLNSGLSCPNRDGSKGVGGCTYCSHELSGDFAGNPKDSILTQIETQKARLHSKWDSSLYIPYFQAGTNTYAPLDTLKTMYETALQPDNVVGLAIATRADCLPDNTIDYLAELSQRTYLTLELGLQTIHDTTAEYINRGHTFAEFTKTYEKLITKGINVCIHVIDGLPFENYSMMLETIQAVADMHPHSIKIHMLHILKGTTMAKQYLNGEFSLLSLEDYAQLVCDQLEILPQDVIVQRITGDGAKDDLIAPLWSLKKFVVMNEVDKELVRRDSYQGKKLQIFSRQNSI
jgi:hypothetical protein